MSTKEIAEKVILAIKLNPIKAISIGVGVLGSFFGLLEANGWGFLNAEQHASILNFLIEILAKFGISV